ncbi:Phospho-N-acetylmuramoyl-pentapeptide-transferase [Candidatus Bilamarchaeum dharawalense]|uniref:Phospho-N-acetylmuramoyl-pentapeptide-transferase n=1 Tax=Candidatus Bilamarchaeum dharawalense TaxID=2885759 RepID=A0A5E4LMD5_9ARCH|nr:Phospho-N-acetylmuramoyl-pentapeptide-transferase [Candidatus Bilamarchaeum dharawalense]
MIGYLLIFLISLTASLVLTFFLIPRLLRAKMVGNDINKSNRPEIAEMGGIAIVAGTTGGILFAIFLHTFFGWTFDLTFMLAALITIHSIAFIGLVDDIVDIPQAVKALLPLVAAIPLIVVKAAGSTALTIPIIGTLDFGLLYILVLIPIGIAVASNLTNMLAGFNGMESGMGIVMFLAIAIISLLTGNNLMLIISLSMLGALLGFFWFNRYPSKVFPGDVGNLVIGGTLACTVIVGNTEGIGAILVIPYVIDFFIKALNKFPSKGWAGILKNGKLYAPDKPISFAQYVMKFSKGISEAKLALFFITLEVIFAIIAILLYARF